MVRRVRRGDAFLPFYLLFFCLHLYICAPPRFSIGAAPRIVLLFPHLCTIPGIILTYFEQFLSLPLQFLLL